MHQIDDNKIIIGWIISLVLSSPEKKQDLPKNESNQDNLVQQILVFFYIFYQFLSSKKTTCN